MSILQKVLITASIILIPLLAAGICLAIFLPGAGTSSIISAEEARELFVVEEVDFGVPLSGPEEMMQTALSLACSWLEEDLVISEYSSGADGQRFYTLSNVEGGTLGWVAIDVYGNLLTLQNTNLDPTYSTDINLEKEQAEAIAAELLERAGFEVGSLEITNSGTQSSAALEYVFAFRACLNGIFIDDGDSCEIHLSPVDGRIISINAKRSALKLVDAPDEVRIKEKKALELAKACVQEFSGSDREFAISRAFNPDECDMRLRYVLSDPFIKGGPMLCWKVSLESQNGDRAMGGTVYDVTVDALTGEANVTAISNY